MGIFRPFETFEGNYAVFTIPEKPLVYRDAGP